MKVSGKIELHQSFKLGGSVHLENQPSKFWLFPWFKQ